MIESIGVIAFGLCAMFALYVCWALCTLSKQDVTLADNALSSSRRIDALEARLSAIEDKEPKP